MTGGALSFNDTHFDIVDRDGVSWLRCNQIAAALGYADASAINRIYARNADEFTESMTCSVSLTEQGGQRRETRIFSLRGAHLLGMFATTPHSAAFRRWVLDILDQGVDQAQSVAPTMPTSVTHRADHVVAATRTFNGFMRVATNLKLSHAVAARRANAAALKYTGVDIIGELDADAFLGGEKQGDQVGADPYSVHAFLGAWVAHELPVPCVACRNRDLYAAYVYWCREEGVMPAQEKLFDHRVLRMYRIRRSNTKVDGINSRISVPPDGEASTPVGVVGRRASEVARFSSALLAWQSGDPAE